MDMSQTIAKECNEPYMIVTHDLAIAKPALTIQAEEAPKYNLFICFGAFHIQLAYFRALGHIIDESGGPQILVDTEVLAANVSIHYWLQPLAHSTLTCS